MKAASELLEREGINRKGEGFHNMLRRRSDGTPIHPLVLSLTEPESPQLEAYRRLYRKILYFQQQNGLRSVCITSSQAGEGKTLTALNLAFAMAEDPTKKIVLVDCDFRRPQVANYLGLRTKPGLAAVIQGGKEICDVLLKVGNSRVQISVAPAGRLQEDLYPFLYSGKLDPILKQLKNDFDFIVVDSPPILPILDQDFLSNLVDGILVVIRAGSVSKDQVKTALESMEGKRIIGIVFNGAEKQYSSYYSYAYGYSYQDKYYRNGQTRG